VPFDQRRIDRLGDLERQHGLTGAGLTFDEQRALERNRRVDGDFQIIGRHIGAGAVKTHGFSCLPAAILG
jgi:hypothetical protein